MIPNIAVGSLMGAASVSPTASKGADERETRSSDSEKSFLDTYKSLDANRDTKVGPKDSKEISVKAKAEPKEKISKEDKADKPSRSEKPEKVERSAKAEKTEKSEAPDRTDKEDRSDKADKAESKSERISGKDASGAKGSKKATRNQTIKEFMDSFEGEFQVPATRLVAAMSEVGSQKPDAIPEENAQQVISQLDLAPSDEAKALSMYQGLLAQLKQIDSARNPDVTASAIGERKDTAMMALGQLNDSIDRMNQKFWLKDAKEGIALPNEMRALERPQTLDELGLASLKQTLQQTPDIAPQRIMAQQSYADQINAVSDDSMVQTMDAAPSDWSQLSTEVSDVEAIPQEAFATKPVEAKSQAAPEVQPQNKSEAKSASWLSNLFGAGTAVAGAAAMAGKQAGEIAYRSGDSVAQAASDVVSESVVADEKAPDLSAKIESLMAQPESKISAKEMSQQAFSDSQGFQQESAMGQKALEPKLASAVKPGEFAAASKAQVANAAVKAAPVAGVKAEMAKADKLVDAKSADLEKTDLLGSDAAQTPTAPAGVVKPFDHRLAAVTGGASALTSKANAETDASVKEVMRQAQYLIKEGGGEMKVEMSPEGMGKVHLKVAVENGKVNLEMAADSTESKKLLEKSLSQLKTSLAAQRLSVDHIKVDVTNQAQNSDQARMDFNQGQQREQTRQFWNQFSQNFGSQYRDDSFTETGAVKGYPRRGPDPLEPISSSSSSLRSEGKGSGLNLVA